MPGGVEMKIILSTKTKAKTAGIWSIHNNQTTRAKGVVDFIKNCLR